MAKFFIVFSPEGTAPPVKVYATHPEAKGIAHCMAKLHPEKTFFVMQSSSKPICKDAPIEAMPIEAEAA